MCITEVLFKVSLFSYFLFHFSLYFPFIHLFLFFYIVKVLFLSILLLTSFIPSMGHAAGGAVRLRHCATSRKVAGSIPNGVIVIFH